MSEQEKRGPGRPRKYGKRERTSLELSSEVLKAIDERRGAQSRAVYLDRLLHEAFSLRKENAMLTFQTMDALKQRYDELKALQFTTPDSRIEQAGIEHELRERGEILPRPTTWQPHEDDF